MAFFTKLKFNRIAAWVRKLAPTPSENEVVPIQITVEPRTQRMTDCEESGQVDNASFLATENDNQRSIRWCELSSSTSSVVSNTVSNNVGRFADELNENSIISGFPITMVDPGRESTDSIDISDTSSQAELQMQVKSLGKRLAEGHCQPIVSDQSELKHQITFMEQGETKPSNYIHLYIRIMYLMGTSGFHNEEYIIVTGHHKCVHTTISYIRRVFFVLVVSMSTFEPFFQAKYNVLFFLSQGGLHRFVRVSYNITCLLTSVYCAYTFCHKWKSINDMVQSMTNYEASCTAFTKKSRLCVILAVVTLNFAILRSILIIDLDDISVEDTILISSYQMSEDLFMWNPKTINITTEQLDNRFGTEVNPTTVALSTIRIIRDFSFHLHHGMMWDLIATVVLTMFCWMKLFMKFVEEVVEDVYDENSEEWNILQTKRKVVWQMYRNIRCVFEAVNEVFGPILLLFHITNVLRYAFFMEHLIYPEGITGFDYLHLLYNIVKSEIIYMVAAHMESRNVVIRKVLRNWGSHSGKINVGYTELDINTVLDELDHEPLGLGKGDFVIHKGFHFGLLGLVSSLFVMLASKKNA